jgi:hypothetical protein
MLIWMISKTWFEKKINEIQFFIAPYFLYIHIKLSNKSLFSSLNHD